MDTRTPMLADATTRRFIAHVLDAEAAWTVAGEEGLARVASATARARMVTLLWSERAEAERWGSLIAEHPRTKRLSLADLLNEVLPKLTALSRLVGLDWGAEAARNRKSSLLILSAGCARRRSPGSCARLSERNVVWVLQGAEGPALLMSKRRPGAANAALLVQPCPRRRADCRPARRLRRRRRAARHVSRENPPVARRLGPAGRARLLRGRWRDRAGACRPCRATGWRRQSPGDCSLNPPGRHCWRAICAMPLTERVDDRSGQPS